MEDNKRKLYDALSQDYDMGTFEQFSSDIQDEGKRRKLYDATVDDYDYGDYESFSKQLGFGAEAPAQPQPAAKPRAKKAQQAQEAQNWTMPESTYEPVEDFSMQGFQSPYMKPEEMPQPKQQGPAQAAQKPSVQTEKTTAERNLDAINENIAAQDFPEVTVGDEGKKYKVVGAAAVDQDGTLHLVAKDESGKEVELTAPDYTGFMPDDSVEGKNRQQMIADRAEIDDIDKRIQALKDKDFHGSREERKRLEAQKQRALYRLDNNPAYQNKIASDRQKVQERKSELDEALSMSGNGTQGAESITGMVNPLQQLTDRDKLHNQQVYDSANRMLQDADEILATGLKYNKEGNKGEFVKAANRTWADPDFWTFGMEDTLTNVTFRDVMEKAVAQAEAEGRGETVENPLTPIEEKLVEAYLMRAQAMALRSDDQSKGSKMGAGAMQSLQFMIDMAITGAIGKGITKGATKAVSKALGKKEVDDFTRWAINKFGRRLSEMGAETGAKAVGKAAAKEAGGLGIKLAGDVIETIPKVAVSPLTAQSISQQAAQYDPETGFQSWGKSIGKGLLDAGIEKFSELHGGIYERAAKNVFKAAGAPALYRKLVSEDLRKTFRDIAKSTQVGKASEFFAKGGWNGLWEMAEEMEGAAAHELMGEKGSWEDFWKRENWLEMAGSFAPMTLFGMGTNAGQRIYTERKFEKTLDALSQTGLFNKEALRDVARTSTIKDLAAYLSEGAEAVKNPQLAGTVKGVEMSAGDSQKTAKAMLDFIQAAARMQALDGMYQGEQDARMEEKREEISQAVGGKQFWKEDGNVEVVQLPEGDEAYVVSAPNEDGMVSVVHMDGTPGFANISGGTTVMPMEEYLSLRIQTDQGNQEAERMETERGQKIENVASQYQLGQEIQYPAGEEMASGRVFDLSNPDVMIVQNNDGTFAEIPWEEVASWTGQDARVLTDEEQAEADAGRMEAEDDAKADIATSIEAGIGPDSIVTGEDGQDYVVKGVVSSSINPETGTAKFFVEKVGGPGIAVYQMDLPYADFVANGLRKGEEAARAEAERLAQEEQAIKEQKAAEEAEKAAQEKAKKEEKEKRSPEYMDNLLDENPEEFARLNDEQNKDGGADTRELFQAKIEELTKQVEALAAQRNASTVPSERRRLLNEANKIRENIGRMRGVLESYESEVEEAPAAPAPQGPSGHEAELEAQRQRAQEQADKDFPKIQEKWNEAPKITGFRHTKNLPNGKKLRGHYVLTEADAVTPSHDPLNGYKPSVGFPRMKGSTVNDRDYEHDKSARQHTEYIAGRYNGTALDNIPTVTPDGVVIDGNGRTMASQIAARNGSDAEYLETLREEAQRFGFSEEQVAQFQHPRVVFVTDESVPYTVDTFAQFNDSGMKEQTMEGEAVKDGKILAKDDNADIVNTAAQLIGQFDTVDQALRDEETMKQIYDLFKKAGVFKDSDFNRMFINDKMTDTGKERIKNALLGIIFDEDVIRLLMSGDMDAIKKKLLRSMAALVKMRGFQDRDYDLTGSVSEAVRLINAAMQDRNPKSKDIIADYMQRMEMVADEEGNMTQKAPQYSERAQRLAHMINYNGEKKVKDAFSAYLSLVENAAAGEMSMFGDNLNAEDSIKSAIFEQTGEDYGITDNSQEQGAQVEPGEGGESAEPSRPGDSGGGQDRSGGEEAGAGSERVEPQPEGESKYDVLDDEIEALEREIAAKINSQLNAGLDPTLLPLVGRLAIAYIERGAYKIADFAKKMVAKFGDAIRDYIAPAYAYARQAFRREKRMDIADRMDSADTIDNFDVDNFDKAPEVKPEPKPAPTVDNIFAEAIGQEQAVEEASEDFGGLFAQPIENQQNNQKNSRISKKESVTSQKEARDKFSGVVMNALLKAVQTGEKPYAGITQLRQAAKDAGMEIEERGASDALLQEIVEDAIVRAARILNSEGFIEGKTARERYDSIVKLYEMQPVINQRSSERIAKQQYSTPLPMGFVADKFGWTMGKTVLEPTAGNGMMVFAIPSSFITANEIDPVRLENLRAMRYKEVTDQDATQPFPAEPKYDTIIANPPFGSAGEPKTFDGVTFTKLEHIIALNALDAMKPDGKAAIIVGGNMEYYPNGAVKTDMKFYSYLYDHYNVKGIVDMDGKLYAKQGTTYPTRMILIDGKRSDAEREETRVYPPVKDNAPRKAETFADLYDIVEEVTNSEAKTNGNAVLRTEGQPAVPDNGNASGSADNLGYSEESRPDGDNVGTEGSRGSRRGGSNRNSGGNELGGSEQEAESGVEVPVRSGLVSDVAEAGSESGVSENVEQGQGDTLGADREGEGAGDNGGSVSAEVLGAAAGVGSQRPQRVEEKRELSSDKLHYVQHSASNSLDSVAPAPMVEAMDQSLARIEEEYGPIDDFVRKELGYANNAELYNALAAEQVDSVAMAIYQMKNGNAMIIGDQTGVGKGRQMAALIRWAARQGKKPVFVTQKSGLFSDLYRDLADIGSADLVPFIFNADGDMTYEDKNGNLTVAYKHASDALLKQAFEKGELPEGCDYAILTYSQVSSGDAQSRAEAKKNGGRGGKKAGAAKATPKADFLRKIANGNYILMDESHTAAGESNTGAYFQSLLKDAAGATFASATFAKRPDTMPLYALRTSMSQANVEPAELIASIKKGGVALQEIMSRALTQTGQMVRRERDMSDVVTDWISIDDPATVQAARENYDKTIEAFNAIINFQENFVRPAIEGIAAEIAMMGSNATTQRGTEKLGIDNTPFASKTYNYTKQLMLALKVDAIVDKVKEEIAAGRHPVIALESTMESGLKDEGYSVGDKVTDTTFASSLLRGLNTVMKYAIKDADGVVQAATMSPEELGPAGEQAYYDLQDFIRESTGGVFLSPLDLITMKLQDAGLKVGELTGRELVVQRGENGDYVIAKRDSSNKKKKQAASDFNSGKLDVLILNKAASTGISLHASSRFKDQRQRAMILAQPMSDINDYMQMIGRIDRTGQVHRGYYINLSLPVAAEQRFNMMLSTKLKSLNANTAADQEGGGSVEAVDLLNKYGDQVVIEYLRDHPDIYGKLGNNALKTATTGGKYVEPSELDDYTPKEDDARRITGRVALLTTQEQEEFYNDVIQRYNDLIQYLDDTGTNDLKITTVPLRAETVSKKVSSRGVDPDGDNPFAKDAYVETVEMDNLRKPMKSEEVKATIEKLNGGLYDGPQRLRQLRDRVTEDQSRKTDAENERYEKAKAKMREDIAKFTAKVNAREGQSEEGKAKDIREYVETQNEKVEQKHQDNLTKIGGQAAGFRRKLEMFQVGATYLVPDQLDNQMFMNSSPAIFCGYKVNENKMTPSTTFAVFAVLDGRRKVEQKLSQPGPLEIIKGHSSDNWGRTREVNLDNWDEKYVNTARKKGHIMTGNILQAIADTQDEFGNFPGQLVSYTDIDGNIHDGILMPDNWNPGQLRNSGLPINTKINDVLKMKDVESTDGKVEIISYYGPNIDIRVPKSKKEGGKYFQNEELAALSRFRGGFHTYRGKMEMEVSGEENIRKALDILSSLGVRVADESDMAEQQEDNRYRYRIREDEPPTNRGIGYKVFFLKDGKLYPPMVANPNGESTPTGIWLDADAAPVAGTTVTGRQQVKAGGKGTQGGSGSLSYRPGWHLGEIPYAIQFNRKDANGEKTLFPKNFVWAEVEYAADVNYQEDAMSYGYNKNGNFQHSLAGLPAVPKDGFYTYRTNPNPETDPWIITGAMRVKRLLTPSEVDEMVRAAGRAPQPREEGAVTDAQIEALNQEIERRSDATPDEMEHYINDLADNLGVKVYMVYDVNSIKDDNENTQRRKRRSKGFYDTKTGKIVIVLPNAANVADAEATVFHEAVGHEGMRGMFGDKFDSFLDEVYADAGQEMRERIYDMQDKSIADKQERRREATEEYIAEMAERGVEDDLEMSFWERVKAKFRELVRALGVRFKFTDADIRYNLWKSKRYLAKANESLLDKADRIATDRELRRDAEASYEVEGGNDGFGPDNTPGGRYRYRFIGERGAANLDEAFGAMSTQTMDMQVPAKNAIMRLLGAKDTVKVERAVTRISNLEAAKQMAEQGKNAATIKAATGWEQGKDNKWRYEESDVNLNADFFKENAGKDRTELKGTLFSIGEILEHDAAYKSLMTAYPELAKVKVSLYNDTLLDIFDATRGYYDDKRNLLMLNPNGVGIFSRKSQGIDDMRSTLVHEIQHIIQGYEGFASGGNTSIVDKFGKVPELRRKEEEANDRLQEIYESDEQIKAINAELERLREPAGEYKKWSEELEKTTDMGRWNYLIDHQPKYETVGTAAEKEALIGKRMDRKEAILKENPEANKLKERGKALREEIREEQYRLYRAIAGEVEARNVQTRLGMTEEERRGSTAESTEDVPRNEQIRVKSNGGRSESRAGNSGRTIAKPRQTATTTASRSSRVLRDRAITNDTQDVALRIYGNNVMSGRNMLREILVDQYTAVRTAMNAIEKESGKEATAKEDVTKALNQLSSKQQNASERYAEQFLKPLMASVAHVAEEMDIEFEDIIKYVCLRRALECNELYAKRDAKEYYQSKHDAAVRDVESRANLDRAAKDRLIQQLDADLQNQLDDTERGTSAKYRELRGTDGKHAGKDYGATVSWFSEYEDANGYRMDTIPPMEPGEDRLSYQKRVKQMRKPVAGAETLAGAEDMARHYVMDFEERSKSLSSELWQKINAATGEILRIQYDSHLISREQYEDIKGRSQYYVPLRGFDEMTAEDAFSYVTDDLSDTFVPALMRAGGRISKPDSPFGFIAGMAASTINEAYKNMAVQALYRFIANRKDNSLAVVSDSWYTPTGRMVTMADVNAGEARREDLGKEIWEPVFPDLGSAPDLAGQESVMEAFNSDMERKALLGQAVNGTAGLNLRDAFVFNRKGNEKQHFVRVKVLGKEQFIVFRGDPRAAQAINGILNPDTRDVNGYTKAIRSTARVMAQLCTSYSIPFWFSNFFRDGQTALINTFEKEGPEYAKKMMMNIPFALGVVSAHFKGGNTQVNDNWSEAKQRRVRRLYDEYQKYAAGGAITGYSVIFNHTEYDKQFKRAIREKKSDLAAMWSWIGDTFEQIGRISEGIEQVFRFATFITSREAGRPMEQCIDDAKNVTVNFNRKGSYRALDWKDTARISTFDKKTGTYSNLGDKGGAKAASERAFIWFLSQVAPWVRTRFMFVNPNIQGGYTTYSNFKISPLRTASAIFTVAMTSFLYHLVAGLFTPDPDDRDKKRKLGYTHLTDYQRRSSIVLPELGGVRVTIPLSQEYAPFWAAGDIVATAALKEKYDQNTAWEIAKAVGDLLPVNVTEPTNLIPDPLAPTVEAVTNRNYQGKNIYQKLYNEASPDYKRAYEGTWTPFVDLSAALNKAMSGSENTVPIGYGQGTLGIRWNNPAAWQHIVEGMGGTTLSAMGDLVELTREAFGPEDVKLSNVPVVNRFVKNPYEYGTDWYLKTEAKKYKDLAAEVQKRAKLLEKSGDMAGLDRLYQSDNWAITELYDTQYKKDINRLENEIRKYSATGDAADAQFVAELQRDLEVLQHNLIQDVNKLLKERK